MPKLKTLLELKLKKTKLELYQLLIKSDSLTDREVKIMLLLSADKQLKEALGDYSK